MDLNITTSIVHIKLVDTRYNVALCEFFDPENLGSHLIWLPIHQLYEPDMPLAPRSSGQSKRSVCNDYL